jgi:succinate-semialdehyde dehydrogenase/glutarate-semialdehyde dehydrogenase
MTMKSRNPATEKVWAESAELDERALDEKLDRAIAAFAGWRQTSFEERAARMAKAAEVLDAEREKLAELAVREMGKPIRSARAEVDKCAAGCRYYAQRAKQYLSDERVEVEGKEAFIRYLPIGPVLAVMPWNFPYWQVFRFIAPTLMAGNVGLLKHASNVPKCALAIESVLERAGFPAGVFQTLLIGSAEAQKLVGDRRVRAVSLTGSEGAGMAVGGEAGRHIKRSVLELGGNDAFVVLPSCDLDAAVKSAVAARTINNGQSCIAGKRFIVHAEIYDRFCRGFVDGLGRLKVGDPMAEDTDMGPLSSESVLRDLTDQVERLRAAGARVLTGGGTGPRPGYFFPPTAIDQIPRDCPVWREELFGPVAMIARARDLDEAITLANDSDFGLGSSAWTRDPRERERLINDLQAGCTYVDGMVVSDPRLPFGGAKRSGIGRELGRYGILEFVNVKTVVIESKTTISFTE